MLTRAASALLLLTLAAGCAANNPEQAAAPAPSPSASVGINPPVPSTEPGSGKPSAGGGAETISGTVTAGVEPNCLLLQAGGVSHLLVFDDPAMRSDAAVGEKITLVGRSAPSMMSTCQQGVPFIVSEVRGG